MIKKISTLLLSLCLIVSLYSCGGNEESSSETPSSIPHSSVIESSTKVEDDGPYVYEGTLTVSPYHIYNEDGTEFLVQENMFDAIRKAGENSKSSNKMYVEDATGLKIFQRQSQSKYWCYDGLHYVGTMSSSEALAWGKTRARAYIVDGKGTGYVFLGAKYYEGSDMSNDIPLELNAGAYNYMFSKAGVMTGGNEWINGYGYMECYCRLSEATYTPTQDDGTWNAYIFINGAGGTTSDLGMIGVIRDGKVVWALVRNCSYSSHINSGDSFNVLGWTPITTMEYDSEKGVYCGADDLFFQCWQTVNGWILKITNLRTNEVFTLNEYHEGMFSGKQQYFRFLLAASYCPVVQNVWNARCGASLRNVLFDNIYIARYNPSDTYDKSTFEEFYPGSETMIYGFSQGTDCSSMVYGTYETDGTYASGNSYKAGDKFVSYSCYYDGGGHYYDSVK